MCTGAGVRGWCEVCRQYYAVEAHPDPGRQSFPEGREERWLLVKHDGLDGASCSHSGVMPECIVRTAA
ncbi:MAG: hypothetical protein V1907_02200 [Candidatus Kerfeldbacteria bacterium]